MAKNKLDKFITSISKTDNQLDWALGIFYILIYLGFLYFYRENDIKFIIIFNIIIIAILTLDSRLTLVSYYKSNKINNKINDFVNKLTKPQVRDYINYLNSITIKKPTIMLELLLFLLPGSIKYMSYYMTNHLSPNLILETKLLFTIFSIFCLIKYLIYIFRDRAKQTYIDLLKKQLYNSLLS